MGAAGCDSTTRFMIDEAVTDLMLWVEGKEAMRKPGKPQSKQPRKGETWVPMYGSVADILAEYGSGEHATNGPEYSKLGVEAEDIAAIVASLETDTEAEF